MSDLILGQIHGKIIVRIGLHQCLDLVRLHVRDLYLTARHSGRRNGEDHSLRVDTIRTQCVHQVIRILLRRLQHTVHHDAFRGLDGQYLVDLWFLHLIVDLADLRKGVTDLNTQYAIVHCHASTLPLIGSLSYLGQKKCPKNFLISYQMQVPSLNDIAPDTTARIHCPTGQRLPPLRRDTVPWRGHVLRRLLSYGSDGSRNQ